MILKDIFSPWDTEDFKSFLKRPYWESVWHSSIFRRSMVASTVVLGWQSIKLSDLTFYPKSVVIVLKCCLLLITTTTNKQTTRKRSTCAHLSSHCTADQSSTTRVSEEEQEERRTKILWKSRSLTKDTLYKGWSLLCVFYGTMGRRGQQLWKAERRGGGKGAVERANHRGCSRTSPECRLRNLASS